MTAPGYFRRQFPPPIAARQRVLAVFKARAGGAEENLKTSPLALLKAKEHKIAHLEEQLAAADAGSLFDLKHDSADNIARAIADSISETKFRNIVKAATAHYKAKQRPAG